MQTSGILIHLDPNRLDVRIVEALDERPELTLGELAGNALPAVLEATGSRSSIDEVRELERMTGITRVDIVFVGTDEQKKGAD